MKILIFGNFHHKNMKGFNMLFEYLNYSVTNNINQILECDYIISPSIPIDTSKYPNKKFVFGPHFSLFPDNRLYQINNVNKNSVYIQPSLWPINFWQHYPYFNEFQKSNISVPFKPFFLPVNTEKFKPIKEKKEKVFIYFKRRNKDELTFIKNFLHQKNIDFVIFDYVKRYNEKDYLKYLQNSKYGIILDAHESQGFAIEEALSCDVPLLVWNVTSMNQEEGSNYLDIPATSIPYWDERCGEYFYNKDQFEKTYNKFINKLNRYKPREFVIENLSVKKCAENFKNLL
tara:strand:- start:1082 stop:1942 length:861 start_codon:yes stop_codon:yes gene_type:complete